MFINFISGLHVLKINKRTSDHSERVKNVLTHLKQNWNIEIMGILNDDDYMIHIPKRVLHDEYLFNTFNIFKYDYKSTTIINRSNTCKIFSYDVSKVREFLQSNPNQVQFIQDDEKESHFLKVNFTQSVFKNLFLKKLENTNFLDIYFVECLENPKTHNVYSLNDIFGYVYLDQEKEVFDYGKGKIVSMIDTGLDVKHCIFKDINNPVTYINLNKANYHEMASHNQLSTHNRIVSYNSFKYAHHPEDNTDDTDLPKGHGTFTSGSLLYGSYNDNCVDNKFFNKAKILFIDVFNGEKGDKSLSFPNSIYWVLDYIQQSGSFVVSCSWGVPFNGYTHMAFEMDKFIRLNDQMTIVVAAGNDGPDLKTLGSPAVAKNVITVGASSNTLESYLQYASKTKEGEKLFSYDHIKSNPHNYASDCVPDFSSRGPTFDGRIKPDFVAPGSYVYSASATNGSESINREFTLMRGTSMVPPLVINSLMKVEDILKSVHFISRPSNTLKKAILINFSSPIHGVTQKTNYKAGKLTYSEESRDLNQHDLGHGKLNLLDFFLGHFNHYSGAFSTCTKPISLCAVFPFDQLNFMITMVYDDIPALPFSEKVLINNLNLRIHHFDIRGNLMFIHNGNNVNDTDDINNVEKINFAAFGGERIRVTIAPKGIINIFSLVDTLQRYSLVWNSNFKLTSCEDECLESDLLYQCFNKYGELGHHRCEPFDNYTLTGIYNSSCTVVRTQPEVNFHKRELNKIPEQKKKRKRKMSSNEALFNILIFFFVFGLVFGLGSVIKNLI